MISGFRLFLAGKCIHLTHLHQQNSHTFIQTSFIEFVPLFHFSHTRTQTHAKVCQSNRNINRMVHPSSHLRRNILPHRSTHDLPSGYHSLQTQEQNHLRHASRRFGGHADRRVLLVRACSHRGLCSVQDEFRRALPIEYPVVSFRVCGVLY